MFGTEIGDALIAHNDEKIYNLLSNYSVDDLGIDLRKYNPRIILRDN